jgi:alpha-galactosidase
MNPSKSRLPALLLAMMLCPAKEMFADDLAPTPPMGWNSWNTFQTRIDEHLIETTADAMNASGMRDAGYIYVNLDDGWSARSRDSSGNLAPDPLRFPHGMRALADYLHQRGFKFGIYNCAGAMTCAGYPGGRDHEAQDAKTYASWGVDYLKYDWCDTQGLHAPEAYKKMHDCLLATGRPIVLSICEWGKSQPWTWANGVGQLWRTTGDIDPSWDGTKQWQTGWTRLLEQNVDLYSYAGPGHWNDPDMLEVGNAPMSLAESRAHFSLWCMLAAPLIAGNDVRHMSPEICQILTNRQAIALDQDPLGKQAKRIRKDQTGQVWVKELTNGRWAICLFNTAPAPARMNLNWSDLPFLSAGKYRVHDVWKNRDVGDTDGIFSAIIPSHDVILLRLEPEK